MPDGDEAVRAAGRARREAALAAARRRYEMLETLPDAVRSIHGAIDLANGIADLLVEVGLPVPTLPAPVSFGLPDLAAERALLTQLEVILAGGN